AAQILYGFSGFLLSIRYRPGGVEMSTSGGSRGPVPKRSSQRRRRNSDGVEIATAPAAGAAAPEADPEWHPLARDWYAALGESGQATFMEPSDWAQARIWAELISRELHKGRAS